MLFKDQDQRWSSFSENHPLYNRVYVLNNCEFYKDYITQRPDRVQNRVIQIMIIHLKLKLKNYKKKIIYFLKAAFEYLCE
jgi:hypothetical protein